MDSTTLSNGLTIASWNSRGHSDNRIEYMSKIINDVDILLVQEHWHFESNICTLVNKMNDVHVYGISRMDSGVLLSGRPHGGCAFLYSRNLKCNITPVEVGSNRCCAIIIDLSEHARILLFNVYMPCDTEYDQNNHENYVDVLSKISQVRMNYPDILHTIIGGDFNTDFTRRLSLHTTSLEDFIHREGLVNVLSSLAARLFLAMLTVLLELNPPFIISL